MDCFADKSARNDEFGCEFLAVRHSELVLDKRRIHNRKICVNLKCDFEFKRGLFSWILRLLLQAQNDEINIF